MNKYEKIMRLAIDHYGEASQGIMLIEELGELLEAMESGDRDKMVEEIADVSVCLKQVLIIEGMTDNTFAELATPGNLCTIAAQVMIMTGRQARGRKYSNVCLWMLSGWLRTRAVKMRAVNEVKAVVKKKLLRLEERMSGEEDNRQSCCDAPGREKCADCQELNYQP